MAYLLSPGVSINEVDLTTVVPAVATSTGAIAGYFRWGPVGERTLVNNENTLVSTFGKPTSLNPETFFTAASFLSYGNSLYVVRTANTTDAANGSYNSIANTATISGGSTNAVFNAVKGTNDYYTNKDGQTGVFDPNVVYVTRFPGDLGNSLRISVCDSVNAYSSNVALYYSNTQANVTPSFSIATGSNTATILFASNSTGADANNYASIVSNSFVVGDLVKVGNASIGTQLLRITAVNLNPLSASIANVTINFADPYRLATNFVANNTQNGNTTSVPLNRNWQYSTIVTTPPINSSYVAAYGNNTSVDTMHVVVIDQDGLFTNAPGTVLERFTNISRATDAKLETGVSNYYKTVINQGSKYIWTASERYSGYSNTANAVTASSNTSPMTLDFNYGQDCYAGFTEANATLATVTAGYDLFNSKEVVDISLLLQGKPIGGSTNATTNGLTANNYLLANYLIQNIASVRQDCVVFITPDDNIVKANAGQEATAIVNWRSAVVDSTYAVMDSGYKYTYDKYNDLYRYVPTNGDVAGLCARTDQTNDSWWSPAGFNRGQIKNVVKLRYNPNQTDRDLLYKNNVNPIVTFPGQGTILYGDKTLTSKPSAFDRINVRRLFITLEKAISTVAKYSLFEFNDEFTRAQFRNLINPYLRDVQSRRGITDFLVVCDTTNNTAQIIDSNQFIGDIYIKPARSINYIQLNFVAVGTGVQFSTVVGQF